jgi:DNA-binding MarR family transcriptional regulator
MVQQEKICMRKMPIPYLLKLIVDQIRTGADADLKSMHLTLTQSRVLAFLVDKEGQATQKEIEDFLQVSHPTVVGIVSRMEKNGYLKFSYAGTSKIVRLTPYAKDVGQDMVKAMAENDAQLMKGLSKKETAELQRMLLQVYQNIK